MGARTDQAAEPNTTDEFKAEDESLSSARAAQAIPLGMGTIKTTIRWLTPIYGQRVVKVPAQSGGKK
jgi:hypothetical protein